MRAGLNLLLYVGVICCAGAQEFLHGDVRLQSGSTRSEGRVEIYDSETEGWGTVCNEDWDLMDADVVCRQLEYDNASDSMQFFGEGTGPILLNGLQCFGNETNLYQCPINERRRCDHRDDAGVVCQPAAEPPTVDPVTVGVYVFIPFAIFVIVLLLIIGVMLLLSVTHKKETRENEEQSFQTLRFKGLSLKDQRKLGNEGVFRKRRNSGISRSSSQFSVERNIPRAALGEGSAHPWQLTVRDTDTEIELVPVIGGEPKERSPHQKTIGVLNPLASTIDGQSTEQKVPKRYTKQCKDDDNDSDDSLDPYD